MSSSSASQDEFDITAHRALPTMMRVFNACMKLQAFDKPHPLKQPGAPTEIRC
jgi:hypothetical protein